MNDNFPIVTNIDGLIESLERLIAEAPPGETGYRRQTRRSARAVQAWRASRPVDQSAPDKGQI